jgi:leucyl-tRNA---protein transferase
MALLRDIPLSALQFYLTAPYQCSYLAEREARSQVATPSFLISTAIYSELVRQGFRRSGTFTYRPRCDDCAECVPVRVKVNAFTPNRSQRRVWKKHHLLEVSLHPLEDKQEYFDLYQRYQNTRHLDGGMSNDSRDQYQKFLLQSHVDSMLVEFREQGVLRMVSIIDALDDGLSSVYTFFDPDITQASFGTYNVMWQIELCRQLQLPYLYLGYWIKESRKMAYKSNFQPLQGFIQGVWQTLPAAEKT